MKKSKLMTGYTSLTTRIVGVLFLFSCDLVSADDWLADEVLRQLQEIRTEVKALRGEVADLHQQLDALQAGKGASGSGATEVKLADEPMFGQTTAKVAIVEFSDFQCPFCTRYNKQTLPQIKDTYIKTGQVQYVMKDFPLEFHAKATDAAIAGYCANEQGRYEGMRNALFENPRDLGRDFYMNVAEDEQLDAAKFAACLDSAAARQEVEADLAEGMALGVTGTPTFFVGRVVNGTVTDTKMITGAVGFDRFRHVVEEYLQ